MSTQPQKFVPQPEGLPLEFHQIAARTGTLHLQQCSDCGAFRHPPRVYCASCFSPKYEFVPSAHRGSLYSLTISHRSYDPGWAEEVPYAAIAVELDEGPRVLGVFRGSPSGLELGDRVQIEVEAQNEDFVLVWVDRES